MRKISLMTLCAEIAETYTICMRLSKQHHNYLSLPTDIKGHTRKQIDESSKEAQSKRVATIAIK